MACFPVSNGPSTVLQRKLIRSYGQEEMDRWASLLPIKVGACGVRAPVSGPGKRIDLIPQTSSTNALTVVVSPHTCQTHLSPSDNGHSGRKGKQRNEKTSWGFGYPYCLNPPQQKPPIFGQYPPRGAEGVIQFRPELFSSAANSGKIR